ncbi:MAG: YggS family pyridoxal phosphate-dependent enzyme [Aequoribacter sp.]|uniref:YggS family pyridoxal phosphate-dependent enzyme n=1 Tax=Aequoribacter sp. TaxID=2847771 RepID=UPI003C5556AC
MNKATIASQVSKVLTRIEGAASQTSRRSDEITLIAVSKTKPAEAIEAAAACGLQHFGENYLQEALDKIETLHEFDLTWHFIGPIQSNKTRPIAEHFDWVHSVDRLKIAQRLSDQRPAHLGPVNICLQVNISNEDTKSGVSAEQAPELASAIATLPNIRLRGLMAIPKPSDDPAEQAAAFEKVVTLFNALRHTIPELDTLSMGMSQDLEAAIAAGSTMVRIGTDIFGERNRS